MTFRIFLKKYQLIVVGGGPGGYTAAFRAAELGMSVAIVDDNDLGGVCLNWGCIPTKSLLKNAEVFELINDASSYGIEIGKPKVHFDKIIDKTIQARKRLSKGLHFQVRKLGVDFFPGFASFINQNSIEVDGNTLHGDTFIIATGSKAKHLQSLDHSSKNIMTAKDIFNLKKLPKSMTIIGAGAIGVEFAYFFNAFGTSITLLEAQENILPNEDVEVSQWMHKVLKRKKIDIQTNTLATEINDEYVLVSIGVEGNSRGFGLNKIGIEIGPNQHIKVDKDGKTNIDNIYAVGDVVGPPWLAHVSSTEGLYVVEHISKLNPKKIDYNCIPACTYSKPEIGSIGLSQEMLDKDGIDYKVVKSFFNANGKAVASSSTEGFIKILVSKDNYVLGAHIIGSNATEMISEFSLAMRNKLSVENILDSIHPHPTFSEAIFETLMQLK
ncbi:MAG: dihydrolipoyl dehydrogenase [Candidatus Marinimicrobia bacterium]|nr:dihydrolipoyl dehydrogenase [Candidatus Neomarinimicrobiota bacterium]